MKVKKIILAILITFPFWAGCSLKNIYNAPYSNFKKSILVFNDLFEKKRSSLCLQFVVPERRERCIIDMTEVENKVTFNDIQTLNILFYKRGVLVPQNQESTTEMDQAEVVMLYQIVVSPSNQLKTIRVTHGWTLRNSDWFVRPQISPLLE